MLVQNNSKVSNFLNSASYAWLFSVAYALIIGMLFYPGLVYTDSIFRWQTAMNVADKGLAVLAGTSDHHPVLPTLWMAFFYKITGEIGLFTVVQGTAFCLSFFALVRHFSPNAVGNIVATLVLLLPLNMVYAVFVSYDTLFAILMILLMMLLLKKGEFRIWLIPIIVAAAIGTRLNAIVIIPAVFYVLFRQRHEFKRGHALLTASLCIVLTAFVVALPAALKMQRGNSWLIGTAWEYANMATKTNDKRDIEFLANFGVSVDDLKGGICYNGIWCGNEWHAFINKVPSWRGRELLWRYMSIAVNHPGVFIPEKLKYIDSLMGVTGDGLKEAEVGRWREPNWAVLMKTIGFQTSAKKEAFVDRYFGFLKFSGNLFLRPWLVFVLFIAVAIHLGKRDRNLLAVTTLPFMYYGSFFITAQNHELRYFFPVVFIFLAYLSGAIAAYLGRWLGKTHDHVKAAT